MKAQPRGIKFGCNTREEARSFARGKTGARVTKENTYGKPWRVSI